MLHTKLSADRTRTGAGARRKRAQVLCPERAQVPCPEQAQLAVPSASSDRQRRRTVIPPASRAGAPEMCSCASIRCKVGLEILSLVRCPGHEHPKGRQEVLHHSPCTGA
jgi:hypothetical protein